ncbi:MAG: phosphoadenosine phosphosulfate reductase family protein [Bacteroidales bacterium]|nr:phosphoadenosine phosphosulfate reductase family protein [Bacteroidales bacterium]
MFKVVWDKEYNSVKLTMSSKGEALNVSPRPIFWEELDLLGLNKRGWIYPHVEEPLLWACDRRYFYKGEFVLEVKGGNVFDVPEVIQQEGFETLTLQPVDMERLRSRNEDTMFIIEHEAMEFINQTYRRYKNIRKVSEKNPDLDFQRLASNLEKKTKEEHVVIKEDCDSFDVMPLSKAEELGKVPILTNRIEMFISSFSGGKDSQVVLDLVSRVIPSEDFIVTYSDTGYELPTSLELFKKVSSLYKEKYPNLRFYTAKNHQEVLYYWDEMDSPSRIHRWCCAVMKTAPLYRLLKKLNGTGKQPYVMAFEGVRSEESEKRAAYARIGKGVKHGNVLNVRPIFDWNTTEVWIYIFLYNLPINKAYRKGLSRVGCVVCPLSSEIGDCMDNLLFPETAKPFLDKLKENTIKAGIHNVDEYIKQRKWKVRAGGDRHNTHSKVEIKNTSPDFKAIITNPKENIFEWLKTIGHLNINRDNSISHGEIKFRSTVYQLSLIIEVSANKFIIEVKNAGHDIEFISLLRKVLQKSTHCVHCEVCEVECPTGALSVVPIVKIDGSKCIKCHRCLNFIDNGCEAANSIRKTIGVSNMKSNNPSQTSLNKYNTFGLRERWLSYYLENYETYFDENAHGLNLVKQLPVFKKWLVDAGILQRGTDSITEIGKLFAKKYLNGSIRIWEVVWINLCNDSELFAWYINNFGYGRSYSRNEMDSLLGDTFPQYTSAIRDNAMKAFQNTFKESPLGSTIPVGVLKKEGNKVFFTRKPHENISLVALAFSLYRYAERQNRYSLTVSEFYDENQKEGIYRQFGISKDTFERFLLSLQEESNHVLRAELNMGLDNIILRDDLKSIDILKMML